MHNVECASPQCSRLRNDVVSPLVVADVSSDDVHRAWKPGLKRRAQRLQLISATRHDKDGSAKRQELLDTRQSKALRGTILAVSR